MSPSTAHGANCQPVLQVGNVAKKTLSCQEMEKHVWGWCMSPAMLIKIPHELQSQQCSSSITVNCPQIRTQVPNAAQDNSGCHADHCALQESLFASVAWLSWDLGGRSTFWILWELSNSACCWEWQTLCHTPGVGTEQTAPFGRDWQGSHLALITSGLTKSWKLLIKALCQCLLHTARRLRDGTPKEGCKK